MGLFSFSAFQKTMVAAGVVGLLSLVPGTAQAQFAHLGSGGLMEFAEYNIGGGGGGTIFDGLPGLITPTLGSGQMLESGGFYPIIANNPTNFFAVNGPIGNGLFGFRNSDVGAVGPGSNFGGGNANLFATRNGAAAIYSTNFNVADRGFIGTAAALTMTGTANYKYLGPNRVFTTGMWLGMAAARLANAGSFVEAGLTGSIFVNGVRTDIAPIVFAWDGVEGIDPVTGGRADFIAATASVVGVDPLGANTVAFRSVRRGPNLFVPFGANVQLNLTFTLFGDPASIEMIDVPMNDPTLGPLPELAPGGASSNADVIADSFAAPEPGSIAMALIGGMGLLPLLRRRKA